MRAVYRKCASGHPCCLAALASSQRMNGACECVAPQHHRPASQSRRIKNCSVKAASGVPVAKVF